MSLTPYGTALFNSRPKRRSMIEMAKVADLMYDDIVEDLARREHQPRGGRDSATAAPRTPAQGAIGDPEHDSTKRSNGMFNLTPVLLSEKTSSPQRADAGIVRT
ncbi:MAG: hypothetical protein WCJ67_01770 [Thermoleophilia bacterium]